MVDNRESITAKLCAFARAMHSNKSRNKIYDDYLAYDMMGKEEYDEIHDLIKQGDLLGEYLAKPIDVEKMIHKYIAPIALARIHFTESRLENFAKVHGKVQYVICGAGADTFSFRNENEHIEVFEVDHPDTQRYKIEKIKSLEWNIPKNVHFVPVDFEKEKMIDKLRSAGFDSNKKTFFSILGVSYYLTLPIFAETLRQITELSTIGNILAFDYPQKGENYPERVEQLEAMTRSLGEEMQGGFDYNDLSRVLYSLGFQIDTYFTPDKIQQYYFSCQGDGLRAFENVNLISATYTSGYDYE